MNVRTNCGPNVGGRREVAKCRLTRASHNGAEPVKEGGAFRPIVADRVNHVAQLSRVDVLIGRIHHERGHIKRQLEPRGGHRTTAGTVVLHEHVGSWQRVASVHARPCGRRSWGCGGCDRRFSDCGGGRYARLAIALRNVNVRTVPVERI